MPPPTFDRAQVDHLAQLSALSLSDAEAASIARDLGAILAYVEELASVDTSEVTAVHAPPVTEGAGAGAWRVDVVVPGLTREEALREAPRATETGFAVPGFVPSGTGVSPGGGGR